MSLNTGAIILHNTLHLASVWANLCFIAGGCGYSASSPSSTPSTRGSNFDGEIALLLLLDLQERLGLLLTTAKSRKKHQNSKTFMKETTGCTYFIRVYRTLITRFTTNTSSRFGNNLLFLARHLAHRLGNSPNHTP